MTAQLLLATVIFLIQLGAASVVLEEVQTIPSEWKLLKDAPEPTGPISFSIALRQPSMHGLYQHLTTGSRHLSKDEVRALRAPEKTDVDAVMRWLSENGIHDANLRDDWFNRHSFEGDERSILRTSEHSFPDSLAQTITFIHPISNFMVPRHEASNYKFMPDEQTLHVRSDPSCDDTVTPQCIRSYYSLSDIPKNKRWPIRFGIAGFLEQFANYDDLKTILKHTEPLIAATGYEFSVELVNGGTNPQTPGKANSHAALDIQYAMALGFPAEVSYYSTSGRGVKLDDFGLPYPEKHSDNEPYLELIEYVLALPDEEIPSVLSIPYADDELSVPRPYAKRVCEMFGLLAVRRVTVLSATGDGGVRGTGSSNCLTNDGANRKTTAATFPGTCPLVTSVGATSVLKGSSSGAKFSSGGFSQWFSRPQWQDEAVKRYSREPNGHPQGYYNPEKRATPDISAIGTSFVTIVDGKEVLMAGTSTSTVVIAAIIALVNAARLKNGCRSLGWLNQRLYSPEVRSVLLDITEGRSKPCMFNEGENHRGWPAAMGWDAMTGLGSSDDFQKFMEVLSR